MRRSRFTEEQIIGMIKEQEAGRRNALRITILGGGDYATQSLVLVVSAIMAMRIPYRG